MKKIWLKRKKATVKRTKKSQVPPLVILENHRARIPNIDDLDIDTLAGSAKFHAGIEEEELENEFNGGLGDEDDVELEDQDIEDPFKVNNENVEDPAPGGVSLGRDICGEEREEQRNLHGPSGFVQIPEDFEVGPVDERSIYDSVQVSNVPGHLDDGRLDAVLPTAEPPHQAVATGTQAVKELGWSKRKKKLHDRGMP
ncbi:hypothetical protein B0H34DRAFT_799002 [Crassisporium funariophilum]|nr:hypothetical protein B0H34DRAFT_799002 [Crassisporium funariophilum]